MNKKLYAIKNDEGKYWDTGMPPWWDDKTGSVFKRIDLALKWANNCGGHVVTLIEEPEKVVLTKEQAEIVEDAHDEEFPATYISDSKNLAVSGEEDLLMNAYVNGYTVEKKYLVYKVLVDKQKHEYFAQAYRSAVNPGTVSWFLNSKVQSESLAQFTEADIEHYGLQGFEKEEATDDEQ